MNLIDFQNIISSPNQERIKRFPLTSIIFNMIDGCAFNEEDLIGVNVCDEETIELVFTDDYISDKVNSILDNQVVAGVCGGSCLYLIHTSKSASSVFITFKAN